MLWNIYPIATLAAVTLVLVTVWLLVRAYRRYRGARLVRCPATGDTAAVELGAGRAALTSAFRDPDLRIRACTHWPEREDCAQACLGQIRAAPEGCRVRDILTSWYENKSCVLCGKSFTRIDWLDHEPALLAEDGHRTRSWDDVAPETLPDVLATHRAVCWNCHVAETFRRKFPDRVLERPRNGARSAGRARS